MDHYTVFKKCIGYDQIPETNEFIKKAKENFNISASAILWKYETLRVFHKSAKISQGEIITVFNASRTIGAAKFTTIYGFLYSRKVGKSLEHDYVSFAPTYKSADGEYRGSLVPYKTFMERYESMKEAYKPVEDHFRELINKKTILIFSQQMPTDSFEDIDPDLPIRGLVVCWIPLYNNYNYKVLENHVSYLYTNTIMQPSDKDLYDRIDNTKVTNRMISIFDNMKYPIVSAGQKFILLTLQQMKEMGSPLHKPWKELALGKLLSHLPLNSISAAFPVFFQWFLLNTSDETMFSNKIQHTRIEYSNQGKEILRALEDIRKKLYVYDPAVKEELFQSINFQNLGNMIEIPMDYTEKDIILSDYTLVTMCEHIGRTVADSHKIELAEILRESDKANRIYSRFSGPLYSDKKVFGRYVFDFVYALYAMNCRFGIIHGDLHLNNFTLFTRAHLDRENVKVIYNLHGDLYVLPHYGRYGGIIDFSRALISPAIIEEQFPDVFNEYMADQRFRMEMLIKRDMADHYRKHEADIRVAIIRDEQSMYHIISLLDTAKMARGLHVLVESVVADTAMANKIGDIRVMTKEILPFLQNIMDYCADEFEKMLADVLAGKQITTWPNLGVLHKFFGDYRAENIKEDMNMADYFNIDNPIKYGLEKDNMPEVLTFEKEEVALYTDDIVVDEDVYREEAVAKSKKYRGIDHDIPLRPEDREKIQRIRESEDLYFDT